MDQDIATKVNKKLISEPNIKLTEEAFKQLNLIIDNDYTLSGKYFRVLISGKGCDGFTYSVGFTDLKEDDFQISVYLNDSEVIILIDPFAAFYLQDTTIDFIQKPEDNIEGFIVINHMQEKYAGKFFKNQKEKIPPAIKE